MIFVSKHKNHQLWLRPRKERRLHDGSWFIADEGILVEFSNGLYETNDPEIVNMLTNHSEYNIMFQLYDGRPPDQTGLSHTAPGHTPVEFKHNDDGTKEVLAIPLEKIPETPIVAPVVPDVVSPVIEDKYPPLTQEELKARTDNGKRSFQCSICNEWFKSNVEVGRHKKEKHQEVV